MGGFGASLCDLRCYPIDSFHYQSMVVIIEEKEKCLKKIALSSPASERSVL